MSIRHGEAVTRPSEVESTYAWLRLAASVLIGTVGNIGMWAVVVTMGWVTVVEVGPSCCIVISGSGEM